VRAGLTSPRWFTRLRRVAEAQWEPALDDLSEEQLIDRMSHINRRLEAGDLTFAIVSGVSQAFYILNATLRRRLTAWRATLNAATQGLGTIISAKQIFWLQELAETAAQDPAVCRFMTEEPWHPEQFRAALAGSRFLDEFEAWLEEYGHRAVGESDVMSPRFAERPEYLLAIIRRHLLDQPLGPVRSVATIEREQAATRTRALRDIRRAFGFRVHEWFWFRVWYRILCRFLAFRESNRHALMRYLAAVRHLLQALGQKLSARGLLSSPDDLFYLTDDEIRMLVAGAATTGEPSWHALVRHRQQERAHYASLSAPHTVSERISAVSTVDTAQEVSEVACLLGLPVSSGVSEGPVRLILTPSDIGRTRHGEILVAPALDPGMAPAFGVAAGLIVELGGLLSHGAIIAREYGIPAVTNVPAATRRLKNGEWVRLDADRGEVRRAEGKPERSQSRW
jgi:pyruvate,water dikinase